MGKLWTLAKTGWDKTLVKPVSWLLGSIISRPEGKKDAEKLEPYGGGGGEIVGKSV